jgi:DNA-directed RNA polymerase subunit RPC12/RpoP
MTKIIERLPEHYDTQEEHFVDCSKSIVIECRCGEKLLLLGRQSDWRSEGRTVFECGGCGKKLSLKKGR